MCASSPTASSTSGSTPPGVNCSTCGGLFLNHFLAKAGLFWLAGVLDKECWRDWSVWVDVSIDAAIDEAGDTNSSHEAHETAADR